MKNRYDDAISQLTPNEKALIRNLYGISPNFKRIKEDILEASRTDKTVLIEGPTGTGKDIIANNIHYLSNRRDKPFINRNVAEISDQLITSELFGHEPGSFSGAVKQKVGLVEKAHNGTLFLDEIGELSGLAQVKLLTFLQKGSFYRVGGVEEKRVDVRVIAATNRNLRDDIEDGHFRADLFYRLNQYPVLVKPLQERREDIIALIHYLFKGDLDPSKRFLLYYFPYRGNVRELEYIIENDVKYLWNRLKDEMAHIRRNINKKGKDGHDWQDEYLSGYDEMIALIKTGFRSKKDCLFFLNPSADKKAVFANWKIENPEMGSQRPISSYSVDNFFEEVLKENRECLSLFREYHSGKKMGNRSFRLNVVKWCTELFEILTLHRRAQLSKDDIAIILRIHRSRLVDREFEATYGVYLDSDDDDDFQFPHDLIDHSKIFDGIESSI